MEIGYNLTDIAFLKGFVSGIRVYLSGQNLITIDNLKDFDPESTSDTSYPLNKVYNIGLNITF
jgi:hypothetical protein